MTDMLNTAVSGLLSYQRALSTTSHNISNVNTEGYNRQTTSLETRIPSAFGDQFIGNGVQVSAVARVYDQFLTSTIRDSQSLFSKQDAFNAMSSQIDDLLADPQGGISPILQEFFTAAQDVSDDPSSASARAQMISTAGSLVNRFQTFNTRFESLSRDTQTNIGVKVDEINNLVTAIQDVSLTMARLSNGQDLSQQSSDLLDRRDALLNELSQKIDINVVNSQGNNITVMIGNGQTVLSGTQAFTLATAPDPKDASREVIIYQGLSGVNDISAQLTGGEIGGLLDFQNNVLEPTINSLGRLAVVFASSLNQQHQNGMDLNGALGGNLFSVGSPDIISFTANTGSSGVSVQVADLTQLTTNDYELNFNGAAWQVTSSDGTSSATFVPPALGDTIINFQGLTFTIANGSTPAANDAFTIRPTYSGARTIDRAITDPNLIAAATPIRTLSSDSNLGDATISSGVVTDPTNAGLLSPVTFTFENPATTFLSNSDVVVGATTFLAGASIPYTKNMLVESNGWQVNLNGNPQAGDTFNIESNVNGSGDNRNMLALAQLQTTGIFDNNSANYQEAYSVLVGQVGSQTLASEIDRDAQEALLIQVQDRRDAVSGVNLDEEAANLIKYQQAYEATARVISTVQTLFDTLLNSFR